MIEKRIRVLESKILEEKKRLALIEHEIERLKEIYNLYIKEL